MQARKLLDAAPFEPETVKMLKQAFDAAWASMAPSLGRTGHRVELGACHRGAPRAAAWDAESLTQAALAAVQRHRGSRPRHEACVISRGQPEPRQNPKIAAPNVVSAALCRPAEPPEGSCAGAIGFAGDPHGGGGVPGWRFSQLVRESAVSTLRHPLPALAA
jgi:hypothetical protein